MHICNAVLDILRDLMVENGWTDAIIQANITSVGKADSFVKAAHITHTRHEQQVTACGLYILLHLSNTEYSEANDQEVIYLDFSEWCVTVSLQLCVPSIAEEFLNSNFVVHKTQNKFSAFDIDHAQEQIDQIIIIKDDSGAVGLR